MPCGGHVVAQWNHYERFWCLWSVLEPSLGARFFVRPNTRFFLLNFARNAPDGLNETFSLGQLVGSAEIAETHIVTTGLRPSRGNAGKMIDGWDVEN